MNTQKLKTGLTKLMKGLEEPEFYHSLYESGDVLISHDGPYGKEISIETIVADQYKFSVPGEELPFYEFCDVIDYWYCPKINYDNWHYNLLDKVVSGE